MWKIEKPLENRNGTLFIGGCSTTGLAETYGTPIYVYDENRIRENYRRTLTAFKRHLDGFVLKYAIKANNNLAVLKILKEEGAGMDASSPAEVGLAEKIGVNAQDILYSGNYYTDQELQFASEKGLKINLDDTSQIARLMKYGVPNFLSLRVNPGIGQGGHQNLVFAGKGVKFGILERDIVDAYKAAKKYGVENFGIHMMTGSNVLQADYFAQITEKIMGIVGNIVNDVDIDFDFVDIGGGLGISYRPPEEDLVIENVAESVTRIFKDRTKEYGLGNTKLMMEPGRFIVGDSGIILARVHSIKKSDATYVGIDAGMNTLLRPALYGAYHQMYVANKLDAKDEEAVNICGQICENTDQLAKERMMPKIEEGDLVAILNAGAYGFTMSSQYNTRPRSAEVLVHDGQHDLIRERETFEDIVAKMIVPSRLK